jgi:F-type H+-transporting ATPase subunit b
MTVTFLIVFLLLRKMAWKPILGALKEREKSIQDSLDSAEKAKKQMEGQQRSHINGSP